MFRKYFSKLFLVFFLCFQHPATVSANTTCSVELILALDVSGSVDWKEFRLQRKGISDAFRDPEIIELIEFLPGGISVMMTHWSGTYQQRVSVSWHDIRTASESNKFAQKVEESKRILLGAMTAIGKALLHVDQHIPQNPTKCHRTVIDVSSDGRNNRGPNPFEIANGLADKGTTINALVIIGLDEHKDETLIPYFKKNVVRGVGSFVQTTDSYRDYAQAIKHKILRELSPMTAEASDTLKVAQHHIDPNSRSDQ
jgi:Ca-activated chloride channel family protein